MRRRKLRRRWPGGAARRERSYKHHAELHAYEEAIVLRLVGERGSASVVQWTDDEPERWRARPLYATLRRLEKQGHLRSSRKLVRLRRHAIVFTPITNPERKAA